MRRFVLRFIVLTSLAFAGCRDPYNPTIISTSDSYLVVEGILNSGTGPTKIRLTRSFKLDDTASLKAELNAQVLVDGKDNSTRHLVADGDGYYSSPDLNLSVNQEYRLRIITADGKEYQSDYVVAKKTPAIDSLGFGREEKGVQVYVNTHDELNNTWYYLWDYDETWEIRTYYYSAFKNVNDSIVQRTQQDEVSTCWKYGKSTNILIGSSAALQSDIIFRTPILFIENGSEKLSVRYSVLLRQYALDKKGYEFYAMMKKNTENLGTIFDAQPSEIRGNIHCISDPGELVIGYVTAASMEEKRFFISANEVPGWRFDQDCPKFSVPNDRDSIQAAYKIGLSVYEADYTVIPMRWYFARVPCVDCTARQGSLLRPSYW